MNELSIICVLKSGGDYSRAYADHLAQMVSDHLSIPFKFICFTDCGESEGYWNVELNRNLEGWWSKLEMFRMIGPAIYLDLDTYIPGSLDPLAEAVMKQKDAYSFWMLDAFSDDKKHASGVMAWTGAWNWIYDEFGESDRQKAEGWDQKYIVSKLKERHTDILSVNDHAKIYSYKHHCKNGVPDGADIVCFHGQPRPQDVGGIYWSS